MSEVTEVVELQEQVITPVVDEATSLIVESPEQYSTAANYLKELKSAQSKVTNFFKETIEKAHAAHKALTTQRGDLLKPLQEAERILKNKLSVFTTAQEKLRQEEADRLQAKADADAEKERQRLLKRSEKLKTPELKEQALEQAETVVAPIIEIESTVPKETGISYTTKWEGFVVNKEDALKAASTNSILAALFEIDQGKLNKLAANFKGQISFPGIEFKSREVVSAGRG